MTELEMAEAALKAVYRHVMEGDPVISSAVRAFTRAANVEKDPKTAALCALLAANTQSVQVAYKVLLDHMEQNKLLSRAEGKSDGEPN